MEISFGPRGTVQFNDATLFFRNFEGRKSMYNNEGDRNFHIRIDDPDQAEMLKEHGWNVAIKEYDDGYRMSLKVKLAFKEREDGRVTGPNAYLWSGNNRTTLDKDSISCLDHIEIEAADLDIRPYDWERNGRSGRTAWLNAIEVIQKVDRFQARYEADMGREEKLPF